MEKKTKYKWNIGIGLAVALAYLFVPADVVPDAIPVVGWIDDLVVILAAIANAIRLVVKMKK